MWQEAATYKVQKDVTQKVSIQELLFLCTARCLMLVNICMKFHEDNLNGFKLQSGHDFVLETATHKVQKGITKDIYLSNSYGSCALHVVQCWLIFI